MFESSLIDLDARQHSRKWASLPIAIVLHGAVLASVGIAQVWNVEAVGDPEIVTPFQVTLIPSLPAAPTGGSETQPKPTTPPKPKPETPVQPDIERIQDAPVPDSRPEDSTGPVVLEGPQTGVIDEHSVDSGPSNGPSTGPGPVDVPVQVIPVAAPPKDEILTVGGAVSRPVQLAGQPPRYTKVALHARIEGTVVVEALIDERGRVSNVRVLRGLPMGLDKAAVEAVQSWTFEPAKLGARPVKVYYSLTVKFQLHG
jgi:protein TonB